METLHGRDSFRRTILSGERIEGELVRFFIFRHLKGTGRLRVGVAVSGRVGGAVRRNRLKRTMRESMRLGLSNIPVRTAHVIDYDVVVMLRVSRAASAIRPAREVFGPDVALLCRHLESMERRRE